MKFDANIIHKKGMQILDDKQNVISFEDKVEIHKKLELLYLLVGAISNAPDFNQALNLVLQQLCQKTGWVFGEAWILHRQKTYLECGSAWFADDARADYQQTLAEFRHQSEMLTFRLGEGLPGKVWAAQKPVWFSDASQEPDFVRAELALKYGLKAAIGRAHV